MYVKYHNYSLLIIHYSFRCIAELLISLDYNRLFPMLVESKKIWKQSKNTMLLALKKNKRSLCDTLLIDHLDSLLTFSEIDPLVSKEDLSTKGKNNLIKKQSILCSVYINTIMIRGFINPVSH